MFPEFGGDSSAQTDNFMTKRASGLATYRNTDFFGIVDGLDLTLQYQGKNEDRDVKKQNGDGFGTSVSYDFGGSDFAVSGAYTLSDRTRSKICSAAVRAIKPKPGLRVLSMTLMIFILRPSIQKPAT